MKKKPDVVLEPASRSELAEFCKNLQEAFAVAVVEAFGPQSGEPIPSDRDVWESFDAPNSAVYHILLDGRRVGGVVLGIDEKTQHNALELFFISREHQSHGLGLKAWKAIEAKYPDTLVWETATPYFEERNIHFYVNKCGFHIVEFYNQHHIDPNIAHSECPDGEPTLGTETFFRFEKAMKNKSTGQYLL